MFDMSDGTRKDLKMALLTRANLKIMESETQREEASSTESPATED